MLWDTPCSITPIYFTQWWFRVEIVIAPYPLQTEANNKNTMIIKAVTSTRNCKLQIHTTQTKNEGMGYSIELL